MQFQWPSSIFLLPRLILQRHLQYLLIPHGLGLIESLLLHDKNRKNPRITLLAFLSLPLIVVDAGRPCKAFAVFHPRKIPSFSIVFEEDRIAEGLLVIYSR